MTVSDVILILFLTNEILKSWRNLRTGGVRGVGAINERQPMRLRGLWECKCLLIIFL